MFRVGKNTEVRSDIRRPIFDVANDKLQRTLALRHKAFHIVNVHGSLGLVSDVILNSMGEKLKKRTHLYSNFDQFKAIDKKSLPKEYGGEVPMKEMIGD